jgi:hypothetical protein
MTQPTNRTTTNKNANIFIIYFPIYVSIFIDYQQVKTVECDIALGITTVDILCNFMH